MKCIGAKKTPQAGIQTPRAAMAIPACGDAHRRTRRFLTPSTGYRRERFVTYRFSN